MEPIRLLLVDDHLLFRKGLASLMDPLEDIVVVGQAGDGWEALEKARELTPDLILMDIRMPECDGLKATQLIRHEMPDVKIVMLTVSDDDNHLFEAIKHGAAGYLLKDIEPEELFGMLRGVHRGEAPISGLTAARILGEFARLAQGETWVSGPGEGLTLREKEVLQLVAQGATNKAIATELFITENTVKNHLRSILAKLHLHNRVEAAAYAQHEKMVGKPFPEV